MNGILGSPRRWYRRFANASPLYGALIVARFLAIIYQLFFTIQFPISKYLAMRPLLRWRYFVVFIASYILDKLFPYIPSRASLSARDAEAARLRTMSVAIKKLAEEVNKEHVSEASISDISHRILWAVRAEVQGALNIVGGIDATLMIPDEARPENLRVLARANTDRENASYPKRGLLVWEAMQQQATRYDGHFSDPRKRYKSILAIPLESTGEGHSGSVGVLSIDSSSAGEFDGLTQEIETKLLPYLSLLVLVLTKRGVNTNRDGQSLPARRRRSPGSHRPNPRRKDF